MNDLSGHWHGVYSYPGDVAAVHFDAWLTESDGRITGETSEPGLSTEASANAYALVEGSRAGSRVRFTKVYDALGYQPIEYEGDLDDTGNEIQGLWTISGHGSGSFLMTRSVTATEEEQTEAEEVR
jgi:hypothetical protein